MWKHRLAETLEDGHPKEHLVICRESLTGARAFSQMKWDAFLSINLPDESSCLYEVIRGCRQHKMYFDVDAPGELFEESVNVVKSLKAAVFSLISPDADIAVFSSSSSEKSSFHVIIDGYHVDSNAESLAFYRSVMDKITQASSFDEAIKIDRLYSSNQQLRILGWSKPGKGRFKILEPKLSSERFLHMQPMELLQTSLVSVVGESSRKISLETPLTVKRVLAPSPLISSGDLSSLKIFLKKRGIPFKVVGPADGAPSIINLKRKSPGYCDLCERLHEHENAFVSVGRDKLLRFFCRRDPSKHLKIILEKSQPEPPRQRDDALPGKPSELLKMMVA